MPIFRARLVATKKIPGFKKGQLIGYKIFDAKSLKDARRKKKIIVGSGRKVTSIVSTRLPGTIASRKKLPRSKRFGRGFY